MNTAIGRKSDEPAHRVKSAGNIVEGIDHLIVMVPDLDRSARTWQALGFATTPRGFHRSGGTANHLIMLEGTYIELLGMADPAADSPYRDMMRGAPGPWGIAFRGSAQATFRFWRSRGFPVESPTSLARPVEIGGRNELARFELTMLERSPELPFLLFCCEQLTPQFVWRADLPPHPNCTRSLKEVVFVAEEANTPRQFEQLTGRPLEPGGAAGGRLMLENSQLTFLAPSEFRGRFGAQAGFRAGAPLIAAYVLTAPHPDSVRAFAVRAGCALHETAVGGVAAYVPQEGVVIEWAPEA